MTDHDDLRTRVKKTFGRDIAPEVVERTSGRLTMMLRNAAVLDQWRGKLEGIEPAGVHKTPRLSDLGLEG